MPREDAMFINGRFTPISKAGVSPMDRGFLYGDGLFETMRAYRGRVFRFKDHMERLRASAKALKMQMPYSDKETSAAIQKLLALNGHHEASVRIALSRGLGPRGPSIRADFEPTVAIAASAFHGYPQEFYERGIPVIISKLRLDADSPLPRHKTANYLLYILARAEAEDAGAVEAILLNSRGHVAEAAASNVFIVKGGRIITPSLKANILPGITRKVVLEICRKRRMPCREAIFGPDRLQADDEVFLTNSLMEIMPVTRVGRRKIGAGVPGPVTRALAQEYRETIADD